jgi:signal transduction histidine kinase
MQLDQPPSSDSSGESAEQARLAELGRYEILDTAPEEAFDRLTRLAAALFQVPVALIALIDARRLWFKSVQGVGHREVPRSTVPVVVPPTGFRIVLDTARERSIHPLVVHAPHARFYAAAPLASSGGHTIGALYIVDSKPRAEFPDRSRDLLLDLARIAMGELEARALSREARELALRAQEAEAAKAAFLASMSHELRTPLNAIIGFSDLMLCKEPLSDRGREYLGHIKSGGELMLSLVGDVLDMSKIEAGRMPMDFEPMDPLRAALAALALVQPQAAEGGVTLWHDLTALPATMVADDRGVRQILTNLLSNAVKFTRPGGTVTLLGRSEDDSVVFEVRDTGIGMSEEELRVALEPFGQAAKGYTKSLGGTGLGLPIARRLAELHGGSLRLESRKGQGTRALLSLPRPAATPEP